MKFSPLMLPYARRAISRKIGRLWNNFLAKLRIPGYQHIDILISQDRRDARRKICDTCPNRQGFQCGICLCHIPLKTMFSDEACPDPKQDRWFGQ